MNKTEYKAYQVCVADFFESEGIECLGATEDGYFSSVACDCCGTHTAGNRSEATGFNPTDCEIREYVVCDNCLYYAEYGQLDDMTMMDMEDD